MRPDAGFESYTQINVELGGHCLEHEEMGPQGKGSGKKAQDLGKIAM